MNKTQISVQTLFLIFMSILMVGIVVFGFQKIFLVEKHLSEQERIEIKSELKTLIDACEDPLSKGNVKVYELKHKDINGVCIVGDDLSSRSELNSIEDLKTIHESANNSVVLMKTSFSGDGSVLQDVQVIDSFALDFKVKTFCWFDRENKGSVEVSIACS